MSEPESIGTILITCEAHADGDLITGVTTTGDMPLSSVVTKSAGETDTPRRTDERRSQRMESPRPRNPRPYKRWAKP